MTVSREGRITSIYDKELERGLILDGRTAGFVIFQDQPLNWDAWCVSLPLSPLPRLAAHTDLTLLRRDVDAFHLETKREVNASSVHVLEDGPLRSSLQVTYHLGQSVVKVRLLLSLPLPLRERC